MRVTRIALYSTDEEIVEFDLQRANPQSKYVVRAMAGTDIDEVTPRFTGFSYDGTKRFYEPKLKPRDIVIRLVLNPKFKVNETPSDIRDSLYKQIASTRTGQLELRFYVGGSTVAKINGYITKFEAPVFTQTPEVQITFHCKDPIFRGIAPVEYLTADLPDAQLIQIPDSISTAQHGFTVQTTFFTTSSFYNIQDTGRLYFLG
jgi:hypothetical protein